MVVRETERKREERNKGGENALQEGGVGRQGE